MKPLLLSLLLISSCAEPRYIHPGMSYKLFKELCDVTVDEIVAGQSVTNTQDTRLTVTLKNTSSKRGNNGCFGTFTFVNDKLETITR